MDYAPLKAFATAIRTRLRTTVDLQLTVVLAADSWARRESPTQVETLSAAIAASSRSDVVESIAYTWFNRFCALRYFDLHGWNQPAIVSPSGGALHPEVLELAKQGILPESLPAAVQTRCSDILSGATASPNPDEQVYRILFIDACHSQHRALPFLFEPMADFTELLLPNDLLTSQSILADVRTALTPELCASVEVLGWLYQYYISERKDAVMAAKSAVATSDIPAVTQLFTPNWIVRYLVENALGRLWLRSHPSSTLRDHMQYYVPDDDQSPAPATITVQSPLEIRLIDPACGSGHMLVYAFDLLVHIYAEQGYAQRDIPRLILTHNLYGIDLCPRAAQLAALALVIKARALDPSFLRANRAVAPHITLLRDLRIPASTLQRWAVAAGLPRATVERFVTLGEQFAQASTLGSLITPGLSDSAIAALRAHLPADPACATLLEQIDVLSPRYQVVVANPPYMGNKGMNADLKAFMLQHFKDYKSDLFSAFMVRSADLALTNGYLGFMTPFVWMFISSYEELRHFITQQQTLLTLVQLEYSGFDGATVPICTFAFQKGNQPQYRGGYVRLSDFRGSENQGPKTLQAIADPNCGWFFRASAADFAKIPGSPIAYWVSERVLHIFNTASPLREYASPKQGLATGNNDLFLKMWQEVDLNNIGVSIDSRITSAKSGKKWFPCQKGGPFRKWYGNHIYVVNWANDGEEIRNFKDENGKLRSRPQNMDSYFKTGMTWSTISSSTFSMRLNPIGFISETKGAVCYTENEKILNILLGFSNTRLVSYFLQILSPTLDYHEGPFGTLPIENVVIEKVSSLAVKTIPTLIALAKADWDAYETSWDFRRSPLLADDLTQPLLAKRYAALVGQWQAQTDQMQQLEVENNRIFIEAYGLQDELSPDVPRNEITLTCNPYYRYDASKSAEQLADLQRADTMRELLSYAVGCMMGRYSLDTPGLVLANAGDTLQEYLQRVGLAREQLRFVPDDDGVIPIMEEEWFPDDVVNRTRAFLAAAFGADSVAANQHFIEQALGKTLRAYYQSEFYKNHLQVYKKRPIYWLFRSKKGTFGCLLAMHRYRPDTLSIILNKYVRMTITNIEREKQRAEQGLTNPLSTTRERTEYTKQVSTRTAQIAELREYERTLLELASQQISIDLDDGVKINYLRFGAVLEKIPGLEAAADE